MAQLYFGYGSNLDRDDFERWCEVNGFDDGLLDEVLGPAVLYDWALVFGRHSKGRGGGVLDIWPRLGHGVPGVVFEVDDEALDALDQKEGHPSAYERREVVVELGGRDLRCLTYVVRERSTRHFEPATAYLDLVRRGYDRHGLDPAPLEAAALGHRTGALGPPASSALFVYGSLMQGEALAGHIEALAPVSVSPASLRGRLFELGSYPGLALDGVSTVMGERVVFQDVGAALERLDHVEGFYGHGEADNLYTRRLVDIGGEPTWVYVYAGRDEGAPIPHGDWRRWRLSYR